MFGIVAEEDGFISNGDFSAIICGKHSRKLVVPHVWFDPNEGKSFITVDIDEGQLVVVDLEVEEFLLKTTTEYSRRVTEITNTFAQVIHLQI